jgi:flagellar motor switch protein FliN/FliY
MNWELLKKTNLTIRVRLGNKKVLLTDIRKLDIGSTIELNRMANSPVELMIGEIPIALGEVIIIDGNFGLQITKMLKKVKNGD